MASTTRSLARLSRPPSPYPRGVFHALRSLQLLCSLVVVIVLGYFVYHLRVADLAVPWTFLVLLAVASATTLSVLATALSYHHRTLQPRFSSFINAALAGLWTIGFALLTWNLAPLLGDYCNVANWDVELGVMVCRLYKALEAFTIGGLLFTCAVLMLDWHVLRRQSRQGVYNIMDRPGTRSRNLAADLKLQPVAIMEKLTWSRSRAYHAAAPSANLPSQDHDNLPAHASYSDDPLSEEQDITGSRTTHFHDMDAQDDPAHDASPHEPSSANDLDYSLPLASPQETSRQTYRVGPRPLAAQTFAQYAPPFEQTRYDGAGARALDRDFGALD